MSRSAPGIASKTRSPCAYVGIQQLQAFAATGRAFQARSEVFEHRTMRRAEPIRQSLNIQLGISLASITVRRDDFTAAQAITQCRVRAECTHDSLQDRQSYTVNNQRTNHNLKQEGDANRNHAF